MKAVPPDARALAETHETPFYLYDMDAAVAGAKHLRGLFPPSVDLLYCVKANPNRKVLAAFEPHVAGLDVSSGGEIDVAVAAGYHPLVMSFAGPGKTDAELRHAIRAHVRFLSIESPGELHRAERIAEEEGQGIDITLRINPSTIAKEFPMKMGGQASQFGIAEEEADPIIARAKASRRLRLRGFHVFSGTQCLDEQAILANLRQTLAIALQLARRHELEPEMVNVGGGFGIPYFAGQETLDVDSLARRMSDVFEHFRLGERPFRNARFILELGRFLIGEHGAYVTRVVDVKETRGKRFVILDGGMHHCFPATGNFGQLIKKNYPVQNLSRSGPSELCAQELVGPLCTPIDSMARAIEMPLAEVGDLIAFLQCGAYCYTASPLLFLSHDTPLELVQIDGKVEVAREPRPATQF